MAEAVETMDGWYALHDLRTIDWQKWNQLTANEKESVFQEFQQMFQSWENVENNKDGSHGIFHIVGQQADIMFVILRPTIEEILNVETALNKSSFAKYLTPTDAYTSVVELSRYRPEKDGVDPETLPETQARLKPILPKWDYVSFYPMSRKRENTDNWYTLDKSERGKLLYEHSKTGRKYAGKVKQIITGSTGLNEWEWGVTLFAHDFLQLKKIVYEMRYDTATARYGVFGDFFVGKTLTLDTLKELLDI